jgi:hypothetical protein
MNMLSLTEAYTPVARHLERLPADLGSVRASLPLQPLDAWIMAQIARFWSPPPLVVDLASEATRGATTALWAAQSTAQGAAIGGWWSRADDMVWMQKASASADCEQRGAVLFVLPANHAAQLPSLLESAAQQGAQSAALVLGIGRTGDDESLPTLLAATGRSSAYRLTCLRELSPFFASSALAAVHRRDQPAMSEVLERIAWLVDGNLDFLCLAADNVELLQQVTELSQANARLRAEIAETVQRKLRQVYRAIVPRAWRVRIGSAPDR